jgi:hypothetical protein
MASPSRPPVPPLPKMAMAALSGSAGDEFGDRSPVSTYGAPTHANYIVAPPPATGQAALRQFADVTSVTLAGAVRAKDARSKEVVFYEVTGVSSSNVWSVQKRFSDFHEFHVVCKEQLCLEHNRFVHLPDFPSRMNIGTLSNGAIEKRRVGLNSYLALFLERMKETEQRVRTAGLEGSMNAEEQLRDETRLGAAIQHFVAFIRTNSVSSIVSDVETNGRAIASSREPQLTLSTPRLQAVGGILPTPRNPASDDIPPVRITRYGDTAFVAMLYVPGVLSKDLYVMMNPEQARHVIVGGRWNSYTASASATTTLETLLVNKAPPGTVRAEAVKSLVGPECYYDTLPVGEFEVTFEVPEPYVAAAFFTDYRDGVFHVVWSSVI